MRRGKYVGAALGYIKDLREEGEIFVDGKKVLRGEVFE